MSLGLDLYRTATGMLEPVAPLLLRRRASGGKEDPFRLPERLGRASAPRPPGPLAWLHGASVGEGLSLLPLVGALQARRPDLAILVTTGTIASAALLQSRLPAGVTHQFAPIDAPAAAARFLHHWRPDLAVFVESEIWPNLLLAARAGGVPTALVSARLSDRSLSGWAKAPRTARSLFRGFRLVLAQDDVTAERLAALGAPDHGRLNLKLAAPAPPVDLAALRRLRRAAAGRPVLVAASTHPGEEPLVHTAFAPLADRALLVIAPRHPIRGIEVAAALDAARQGAGHRLGDGRVYVADALGELGAWLSLAASVFLGGSLAPDVGGHNPIEAARLHAPIVAGPHTDNWREIYGALAARTAAVTVADTAALTQAWRADLDDPAAARARARRAAQVVERAASGLDGAAAALVELLP